jgi:hypothetical protein
LTAVVAFAGIAFGIFVSEDRAVGFPHCTRDVILGRYQLDALRFALLFAHDRVEDLFVLFLDVFVIHRK